MTRLSDRQEKAQKSLMRKGQKENQTKLRKDYGVLKRKQAEATDHG